MVSFLLDMYFSILYDFRNKDIKSEIVGFGFNLLRYIVFFAIINT